MAILELIEEDDTKQKSPFLVDPTKKDFDSLSLQEKQALLDQLTAEANDPALLDSLAKQLLQQDENTVTMQPHAGYVCKTHVVNSKNKDIGKNKVVYINICYDNAIPEPPLASEKEIQLGLQADPNATYQVPLSMGEKRVEGGNDKTRRYME
jgi:hypothetical protein